MAISTPSVAAYDFLVAHFRQCGGQFHDWYAGIAADARQRLFVDHRVSEQYGQWAYRSLSSDGLAREVEHALLDLGFQGSWGGGDTSTRTVYIYRITSMTNP